MSPPVKGDAWIDELVTRTRVDWEQLQEVIKEKGLEGLSRNLSRTTSNDLDLIARISSGLCPILETFSFAESYRIRRTQSPNVQEVFKCAEKIFGRDSQEAAGVLAVLTSVPDKISK